MLSTIVQQSETPRIYEINSTTSENESEISKGSAPILLNKNQLETAGVKIYMAMLLHAWRRRRDEVLVLRKELALKQMESKNNLNGSDSGNWSPNSDFVIRIKEKLKKISDLNMYWQQAIGDLNRAQLVNGDLRKDLDRQKSNCQVLLNQKDILLDQINQMRLDRLSVSKLIVSQELQIRQYKELVCDLEKILQEFKKAHKSSNIVDQAVTIKALMDEVEMLRSGFSYRLWNFLSRIAGWLRQSIDGKRYAYQYRALNASHCYLKVVDDAHVVDAGNDAVGSFI